METKYFFASVKSINEEERTLDAIASTSEVDRDGDIILPLAFVENLDAFKANPVILATHQHRLSSGSSPVIGSAIPESVTVSEHTVGFTMRFADTKLGQEYWQLYKDKHMRAFSIGFIPLDGKWQEFEDKDKPVWVITKLELLEISAVPVPSNRRALVRAKGYFDTDDLKDALKEVLGDMATPAAELKEAKPNQGLTDALASVSERLDEIKSLLLADPNRLAGPWLGDGPDSPDCGGDKDKSEEVVKAVENAIKQFKQETDNDTNRR